MKTKENRCRICIYILGLIILALGLTLNTKADSRMILLMDVLQLPLSLVFTRFLNLFSKLIPDVQTDGKSVAAALGIKLAVLALALILTGIGAALSLNMRIVPNPGDGIYRRFRILSTRVLDLRRIA